MHVIYVIQRTDTQKIYIGRTQDLKRRLKQHNKNQQTSTKHKNGEWVLIYAEAFRDKRDANERELALKQHGSNKRWLKNRIKYSLLEN